MIYTEMLWPAVKLKGSAASVVSEIKHDLVLRVVAAAHSTRSWMKTWVIAYRTKTLYWVIGEPFVTGYDQETDILSPLLVVRTSFGASGRNAQTKVSCSE